MKLQKHRKLVFVASKAVPYNYLSCIFLTRRPYRLLDHYSYDLEANLLLESLDSVSFKVAIPEDGPCIFTGKTAIYSGPETLFDDGAGHILQRGLPATVCDKTAAKLAVSLPDQVVITDSTWHYNGDGCC